MAKAKSKSKFDFKQFLLKKGEYLAMGVAGLFLVVLTLWGITKWSSAKDPDKISKDFTQKSQQVTSKVSSTDVTPEDKEQAALPAWVNTPYRFNPAPVSAFALTNPQFDPTAKPDTKKENPNVYPIGAYQVDLTRGSMKGFDLVAGKDGDLMIGVIIDKRIDPQDKDKVRELVNPHKNKKSYKPKTPSGGGMGPPVGGGMGQPPSRGGGLFGGGFPMGGGMGPPPGAGSSMGGKFGGGNPYGGMGGRFDSGAQRVEKALEYVPIGQLDEAIKHQKIPAMTVIPLRMITIHAEIPLKKQIDEIKRALRLPNSDEAARWGPYYDGYEVKRKISSISPDGTVEVRQDWTEYDFEDKYGELINSRKSADHFDEGYLAHFVRYEMSLALPLPELVTESSDKYPDIRLKNILDTIEKLKKADVKKVDPSDISRRVNRGTARGDLYKPQGSGELGSSAAWGGDAGMRGMMGMGDTTMPGTAGGMMSAYAGRGMMINPNNPNNPNLKSPVEIEHLLLRFVDVDVEPGLTYEYQIRLRLKNPNYKLTKEVSKPSDAEKEFLPSRWVQLADAITIPSETYLFASDWSAYYKRTKEDHEKEQVLLNRLQVKEHQAVVETCGWMQEIKTGEGGKREPIGAWVVADYPVGRGEYVGRKQYVKLPLWSSETRSYVLREIPDKVIPVRPGGPKDPPQPRGWLMDFTSNKSILVDFEGGKVRTRAGGREVIEEVSSELLVLRGDGKLVVKNSAQDDSDKFRKEIVDVWEKWVKDVSTRKTTPEEGGGFAPRPPGGSTP